ncbi:methylmalonyl-CoA mutase subunit beta [Myroides pelagicus]|uniref:Methylmalonyl-CoA mutase n=1 Tax=Myroides pelagicus TaxID=270914 RepID=A0A7K1GKG7_9FLAO|nr:methylmalonyl-CoA mutase subunit beta [Myroides pelagicus]MEC4114301.1 methylmalonyl-CoA mutase subunit beta [Myroides pelagicus]MTH29351.1 methylmalonyl-CoA mutase [Myroides pelagicus]
MNNQLFEEFNQVSSKEWKNKIQYELKGADYNETLIWESLDGIKVRPFYHSDTDKIVLPIDTQATNFQIVQRIYVHDVKRSVEKAIDSLNRGANTIYFTIEKEKLDCKELLTPLPKKTTYFFNFGFLDTTYLKELANWATNNQYTIHILLDPIHQLETDGNWFINLNEDFKQVTNSLSSNTNILINTTTYQNGGANMIQQVAYALAHVNEYLNRIDQLGKTIFIEVAVGTNYFFEIAKIRAIRMLFDTLIKEYTTELDVKIIARPTKRNKTLYDYNVNMLRTTTECMSAILGGADFVSNLAYDSIYHKENEFGDRIARNQLLILKRESYFDAVNNPAEGAYYIENLTVQIAEKALEIFKKIETADGLITSLIEGTIQRKIAQSDAKEQALFYSGEEVLLGTNKYPNPQDMMSHDLELYPFVKQNPRKTLIVPIIERRLAEKYEQDRLAKEESTKSE